MPRVARKKVEPKAPLTVAFAGSGEVGEDLVTDLLTDYIGESQAFANLPDKIKRSQKGLSNVQQWLDAEEVQYDLLPLDEFIPTLVKYRDEGDRVELVLAWTGSKDEEVLLDAALAEDIPVKDLTASLDDLEFEDNGEPADGKPIEDPPEQPQEQPAARSRGKARRSTPEEDKPAESLSEPRRRKSRASRGAVQAEVDGPATLASVIESGMPVGQVPDEAQVEAEAMTQSPMTQSPINIAELLANIIRQIVKEEVEKMVGIGVWARSGPPPEPETKTVKVYSSEDGVYRLATRGRPRKDETVAHITETEARSLHLID